MADIKVDLQKLLEAGAHFGHFKRRWHPKMAPYIHSVRSGRCIIDLPATKQAILTATTAVTEVVARGGTVLFVGTKRQAKDIIKKAADSVGMPSVTHRWVGGLLTNYATISLQMKKLQDLEHKFASGELADKYSKLELQTYRKQMNTLNLLYGGVKEMTSKPALVFVSDMYIDAIAVSEANKLKIPLVAIADTNVDPTLATYPIPANDDALRSLSMITDYIAQAVSLGRAQYQPTQDLPATAEPLTVNSTKKAS